MNPKHARFVAEYLKDLNGAQAAIRAGYSPQTARKIAYELLTKPDIEAAVQAQQAAQLKKIEVTSERVKAEIARLAFSDVRALFDGTDLRQVGELTDDQAAAISSVEVLIKNAKAGDGQTDTIHKIRLWDKLKALEMLAKHFGILVDRVEHSGGMDITWRDSE